jgi:hypothetical protein
MVFGVTVLLLGITMALIQISVNTAYKIKSISIYPAR